MDVVRKLGSFGKCVRVMRQGISSLIVLVVQVEADNRVLVWKLIVHIINNRFADLDICTMATC